MCSACLGKRELTRATGVTCRASELKPTNIRGFWQSSQHGSVSRKQSSNTTLPTDAAQALIRALISEGRTLTDTLGRYTAAICHRACRPRAKSRGSVQVAAAWSIRGRCVRSLLRSAPGLSNLQKRTDTETAIRTETRTLREAAARLNPPVIDLDALSATAVPSVETISRFRRDMETLDAERGRELDRHAVATDAITAAESKLQELASGRPIPSAEIISAKRLQRDTYWIALRATLFGTSEALAGSQLVECCRKLRTKQLGSRSIG